MSDSLLDRLASHVTAGGGREALRVTIPFSGETLGLLPHCKAEDVRSAAARSREAQRRWARTEFHQRAKIFLRFHDRLLEKQEEVLDLVQLESGKARRHAFEEVMGAASTIRYYTNAAERHLKPRKRHGAVPGVTSTWQFFQPLGLVGYITPWNYPLILAIDDLVAGLLAGNGAVLKPDQQTPFTALWVLDLLLESGLPFGLFSIVTGSGPELGPPLVEEVDYIALTGSTETGRTVAKQAADRLIGVSLELGGKNPTIVLSDADLDKAVSGSIHGCFSSAGQLCISTERLFIHRSIYESFMQRFLREIRNLRLGSSLDWAPDMGSLTSEKQLNKVVELVEDALRKGARLLAGGRRREELGPYFYEPTVLEGVTKEMRVFDEETFGPVVWVDTFEETSEVISKANDTRYGLFASIYSKDMENARNLATWIQAGTISINDPYQLGWGSVDGPMGGMKASGLGRRHGKEGIRRFTQSQTVAENRGPLIMAPQGASGAQRFAKVMTGFLKAWRRFPILP